MLHVNESATLQIRFVGDLVSHVLQKKWILSVFVTIVWLVNVQYLFAGTSFPGLGGQSSSQKLTLKCDTPAHERVTGLRIEYEDTNRGFITRIKARCRHYSDNGNWEGNHSSWTDWSNGNRPRFFLAGLKYANAYCPEDHWVAAIRANTNEVPYQTDFHSLSKIRVYCYKGTSSATRTGSSESYKSAGNPGDDTPNSVCPGYELGNGISLNGNDWFVSFLRLECKGLTAPNFESPSPDLTGVQPPKIVDTQVTVVMKPIAGPKPHILKFAGCINNYCNLTYILVPEDLLDNDGNYRHYPTVAGTYNDHAFYFEVQACDELTRCGPKKRSGVFYALPVAPKKVWPKNPASTNNRLVHFYWEKQFAASAGYQLFVYRTDTPPSSGYQINAPTANGQNNYLYNQQINSLDVTDLVINIPQVLGNNLLWGVTACIAIDNTRRCSLHYNPSNLTIN